MIIADLIHQDTDEKLGRVYLIAAPFPGDIIHCQQARREVMVVRRIFLDLGPDADGNRLSLNLKVRPT